MDYKCFAPANYDASSELPIIRVLTIRSGQIPEMMSGFYYDLVESEGTPFQPILMEGPFINEEQALLAANAFVDEWYNEMLDAVKKNVSPQVNIIKFDQDAVVPTFGSEGAAGADLYALNDAIVEFGQITIVRTGIGIELPKGYEAQIRSRSGLAAKFGIFVVNGPGTIDSDYRGEISVILGTCADEFCHQHTDRFTIAKGDRIAQMVIAPVVRPRFNQVAEFSTDTARGAGGFGSTGVN